MSSNSALKKLHTALLDAREGYETASKDAPDAGLKKIFDDMILLRQHDHEELHRALLGLNEKPDDSGSFMGTVHKTVIGARSAIVGIDRGALSSFAGGEERILNEYDAARDEQASEQHSDIVAVLDRQRTRLATKVAAMKKAADGEG